MRLPHVSAEGISASPSEAGDGPQTAAVAIRCRWGFLRGTFFSFFEAVLVPRARGAGSTLSLPTSAAGFSAAERLQHGFTHHRRFQHSLLGTLTCSPWGRMPGVPTSFPSGLGFCCTRRFYFIYFFPPGFLSSGRFLAISKVTPLLQTKSSLCPWLMVVEVL